MTATGRREKRLARERRRREKLTCHVCGREGQRKTMMVRRKQWVCRNIPGCTERVLNPPPPPVRRASRPGTCKVHPIFANNPDCPTCFPKLPPSQIAKVGAGMVVTDEALRLSGFKPLGYMSDDGIQHHTGTR
jgi:hypothetical protein